MTFIAAIPAAAQTRYALSTIGVGLPVFAGRVAGDIHYDSAALKEYVLTGAPGAGSYVDDFNSYADGTLAAANPSRYPVVSGGLDVLSGHLYSNGGGNKSSGITVGSGDFFVQFEVTLGSGNWRLDVVFSNVAYTINNSFGIATYFNGGGQQYPAGLNTTSPLKFEMTRVGTVFTAKIYKPDGTLAETRVFDAVSTAAATVTTGSLGVATNTTIDNLTVLPTGTLAWVRTTPDPAAVAQTRYALSTVGAGVPVFSGRVAGDLHYNTTDLRDFVLTGASGGGIVEDFSTYTAGTLTGKLASNGNAWGSSAFIYDSPGTQTISGGVLVMGTGGSNYGGNDITVGNFAMGGSITTVIKGGKNEWTLGMGGSLVDARKLIVRWTEDSINFGQGAANLAVFIFDAAGTQTLLTSTSGFSTSNGSRSDGIASTFVMDVSAVGVLTVTRNGTTILTYTLTAPQLASLGTTVAISGNGSATYPRTCLSLSATANGTLAWTLAPSTREVSNLNAAATGAITLPDVDVAALHALTMVGNVTLTFPPVARGKSFTVILLQDATGNRTVTWDALVTWPGGVTPTLTPGANKRDFYTFLCDNGTNWRGFVAGQNY